MLNSGTEQRHSELQKISPAWNTPAGCDLVLLESETSLDVLWSGIFVLHLFSHDCIFCHWLEFPVFHLLPLQRTIEIPESKLRLAHQSLCGYKRSRFLQLSKILRKPIFARKYSSRGRGQNYLCSHQIASFENKRKTVLKISTACLRNTLVKCCGFKRTNIFS